MGPGDLFELDTKGICLICLRRCSDNQEIKSQINSSTSSSNSNFSFTEEVVSKAFKVLMRYLNIDLLKQCNLSTTFLHQVDGFQREVQMVVKMCSACTSLCHEFSLVYKQFEVVRLQLDECVQALYHNMTSGNKDPDRVRDFERTLMQESWNPLRLFHASVADNLRKETFRKCSMRVDKLIPRVTISKSIPNYFADDLPEYARAAGCDEVPICVITETKGDLENEETFEGPTSILKIETALDDGFTREDFDSIATHDEILSINQDDGLQMDTLNFIDSLSHDDNAIKLETPRKYLRKGGSGPGHTAIYCKRCRKKYYNHGNLRTHMLTAHTFEQCSDRLPDGTTASSFKIALEHTVNQYKKISSTNAKGMKRRFMCGFCPKEFRDTFNLRLHILDNHFSEVLNHLSANSNIYSPGKKLRAKPAKSLNTKCKTNTFKRAVARGGRRSVKGHTGPLYSCPVCHKKFTVNACMKRHHKIFHTREGAMKFCCVWCNKAFLTSSNMRLHVNTVHLLEAYHSQIPLGTTKVQLKGILNQMSNEQAREYGTGSKQRVKCTFCGKLNSDAFFFKNHLIEEHFHELINRLNELNGFEGGIMATDENSQQGNGNDKMQEESSGIDSFAHSNILDVPLTLQEKNSNGEDDLQQSTGHNSQQHQAEDIDEPHQAHVLNGVSENGFLKRPLDHDHGEEEDAGSNDLPVLEMYDTLS